MRIAVILSQGDQEGAKLLSRLALDQPGARFLVLTRAEPAFAEGPPNVLAEIRDRAFELGIGHLPVRRLEDGPAEEALEAFRPDCLVWSLTGVEIPESLSCLAPLITEVITEESLKSISVVFGHEPVETLIGSHAE